MKWEKTTNRIEMLTYLKYYHVYFFAFRFSSLSPFFSARIFACVNCYIIFSSPESYASSLPWIGSSSCRRIQNSWTNAEQDENERIGVKMTRAITCGNSLDECKYALYNKIRSFEQYIIHINIFFFVVVHISF